MEVLYIIFPFNKLAREWKLACWGTCYLVGFCWRHVLFFDRENKRQEQGECNENEGNKCLKGGVPAIRLRPNRATPASVEIAKLDRVPINDGGTRYGGAKNVFIVSTSE
jgi:hypothetical protein